MSKRPVAAVSVTLLVIAVGMGSAGCGVPVASGAARRAGPVTVYVANCGSDTVTVIRGDARAGASVKVGRWPCAIAVTPNGKMAFVVGDDPGTVTAINTATSTASRPVHIGLVAGPIVITPDGKTAYAGDGNTVVPMHTATGAVGKPIKVGEIPHAIAVTPDAGNRLRPHHPRLGRSLLGFVRRGRECAGGM